MACLYQIQHAEQLSRYLPLIQKNDGLLLIEQALLLINQPQTLAELQARGTQVYALLRDQQALGLTTQPDWLKSLTDEQWVALTLEFDHVCCG